MVKENMWLQQTQAKSKTITSSIVSSCSTSCIASTLDISYNLSIKLCWSSERQVVLDISHNLHPLKNIFWHFICTSNCVDGIREGTWVSNTTFYIRTQRLLRHTWPAKCPSSIRDTGWHQKAALHPLLHRQDREHKCACRVLMNDFAERQVQFKKARRLYLTSTYQFELWQNYSSRIDKIHYSSFGWSEHGYLELWKALPRFRGG